MTLAQSSLGYCERGQKLQRHLTVCGVSESEGSVPSTDTKEVLNFPGKTHLLEALLVNPLGLPKSLPSQLVVPLLMGWYPELGLLGVGRELPTPLSRFSRYATALALGIISYKSY